MDHSLPSPAFWITHQPSLSIPPHHLHLYRWGRTQLSPFLLHQQSMPWWSHSAFTSMLTIFQCLSLLRSLLELRLLGSTGYFTFPIGYLTDSFNFTHPNKWTLNFPPSLICTGAIHMSANGNSCIEVPWLKMWAHLWLLYFSHTPSTFKSSANPVGLPSEYNLFSLPSPLSF